MQSKFIKSKKAVSMEYNMVRWIDKIIFLTTCTLILIFMLNFASQTNTDIEYTESDIFSLNLIYSPLGISYLDPTTNILRPGTINLDNFESGIIEQRINSAFSYGEENYHLTAKITLAKTTGEEITSIYYNGQDNFDDWAIYSSLDHSNKFKYFVKSLPIFMYSESTTTNIYAETIEQGNVIFEIIINTG